MVYNLVLILIFFFFREGEFLLGQGMKTKIRKKIKARKKRQCFNKMKTLPLKRKKK